MFPSESMSSNVLGILSTLAADESETQGAFVVDFDAQTAVIVFNDPAEVFIVHQTQIHGSFDARKAGRVPVYGGLVLRQMGIGVGQGQRHGPPLLCPNTRWRIC